MAGERRGWRNPHPPPGLGHRPDDDLRLRGGHDRAALSLARDRVGPVRGGNGPGPRRVRALARPQGRVLERPGAQVDRRGDRRGDDHRDGAGRVHGLDRCGDRGRGRGVRDRGRIRGPHDRVRAGQPREGEVRDGADRPVRPAGGPRRRLPARAAPLFVGAAVLSRASARRRVPASGSRSRRSEGEPIRSPRLVSPPPARAERPRRIRAAATPPPRPSHGATSGSRRSGRRWWRRWESPAGRRGCPPARPRPGSR